MLRKITHPLILIAVFFISFSVSCRREPDLTNYPRLTFKDDVLPLLNSNCSQAGCHGSIDSETSPLDNYESVLAYVTPGKAYKSTLYKVITGRTYENFMPPPPSSPLNDDQVRTIFVWIEQGAPKE